MNFVLALPLLALAGCAGDEDAAPLDAQPCTVEELEGGKAAIRCPDGSEVIVSNGRDGVDGKDGRDGLDGAAGPKGDKGDKGDPGAAPDAGCTLGKNADGQHTLTCGDRTVVVGDECEDGFHGDVELRGLGQAPSSYTLFRMTNCTWIRGGLKIVEYEGEALPSILSRVEVVGGDLWVGHNESLKSFSFPALVEVGGDIAIQENAALSTVDGFPVLEAVGGMVSVVKHPELRAIGDFPALEFTGAQLNIWDNPKLASVGSFPKLFMNGGLTWEENPRLVDLGDFPVLAFSLWIRVAGNAALESLPPFPVLTDLNWLEVLENPELNSIAGLSTLEFIGADVEIKSNPKLPKCQIDEVLDGVIVIGLKDISGNDNAATCP